MIPSPVLAQEEPDGREVEGKLLYDKGLLKYSLSKGWLERVQSYFSLSPGITVLMT